tara:strand:+ start:1488 stop:2483 length:996 start_codon:yes stop_codon:yes gene_type:complete
MLAEQYFGDSEENERPFGKDVVEQTQDILELLKEPTMVDVIYKAKAASEYHSIVPHSLKERAKTVHALDALWGAWKNEIMTARGTVQYQLIDGTMRDAILWDTSVVSNGFDTYSTSKDEKVLSTIVFNVFVPADSVPGKARQSPEGYIQAYGSLDQLELDTKKASPKRSINWLSVMSPGFMEASDRRILSGDTTEEQLRNMSSLEVADYLDLDDELARNCVLGYLESQIVFDQEVAYVAYVSGALEYQHPTAHTYVPRVHEELYAVIDEPKLCFIKNRFLSSDKNNWVLGISFQAHAEDASQPSMSYRVPLNSLQAIRSGRDLLYSLVKHA